MPTLAIVGDIHHQFTARDITYFNQSAYDLILFTGDLGEFNPKEDLAVAARLSQLTRPALFIPGNHDMTNLIQVIAEVKEWKWLAWFSGHGRPAKARKLAQTLEPVICGGYSTHSFPSADHAFDVIVARPFSMGGNRVSFPQLLRKLYNIRSMEESIERLKGCVDQCQSDNLIFLAHGGPTGLGDQPTDPWGKDFGDAQGDHGEPDLAAAIGYARQIGKRVVAVVAGHMHHTTKQGEQRRWQVQRQQIHYINAARVPRIFYHDNRQVHHYIQLQFDDASTSCREMLT